MDIRMLTVGPMQENTYLLIDEPSGTAVLVDPGDEWQRIADLIRREKVALSAIWLTHAHLDHIGAIAGLKRLWDVPIHLHEKDLPLYRAADRQAAYYGLPFEVPPLPGMYLGDGETMCVGDNKFTVRHTPGHAPGHVIFVGESVVFGGDLIFQDSIGRTDLPLSSPTDMTASLLLFGGLPGHLVVHPGHGPSTTVARELASNPFLNGLARVVRG